MKNAFTLILALHLLAHAVLGCCWHHDHGAPLAGKAESASQPTVIAKSHGCRHDHYVGPHHGHAHDQQVPLSDDSQQPGPVEPCDGGKCHWLGKDTTEIDSSLDWSGVVSVIDVAMVSAPWLLERSLRGGQAAFSAESPPVRTHLLYQVLVI
jgi:hypothetical protein